MTTTLDLPAKRAGASVRPPAALLHGMRLALQWRLLLLWVAILLIPTLMAALPAWSLLGDALDHSTRAAELAQRLDMLAVADLESLHNLQGGAINAMVKSGFVLTLLLSPLLTGMAATAARAPAPLGMRALVAGGLQQYPRMFYMLLWSIVPLGLAIAIGAAAGGAVDEQRAHAIRASDVDTIALLAKVLLFGLLALAHMSVEAGRAVLVLDRRRVSPFKAWWDGVKLMRRRFLGSVGVWLAVTALGGVFAAALTYARIQVDGPGMGSFLAGLGLTQAVVLVIAWMRCARLFALVRVVETP